MDSVFIENRDIKEDPDGFEALREAGIGLAQAFSGNLWTDYNVHDPGVTILEHLCYGLTELIYRCGFDIEDILAVEGGFDPGAVGMYRPEEILPCNPVTADDLRRWIFDRVAGLENVWVEPASPGLWRILAQVEPGADRDRIREDIIRTYHGVRNLGEDLDRVVILEDEPCTLVGAVEVDESRPPHDILADIYLTCKDVIAPGIHPLAPEDVTAEELPLDELLEGPLTRHGITARSPLAPRVSRVDIIDIIGAVRQVPGVVSVTQLGLESSAGYHAVCVDASGPESVLTLGVSGGGGVDLFCLGHRVPVSRDQCFSRYRDRVYSRRRPPVHDPGALYDLPEGRFRDFGEYTSIQHHFPAVYGINAFGVPSSFPESRKAQARQLKAYLALMEQFLAEGALTLDSAVTLFSPGPGRKPTAFPRRLTETEVPGMETLRPDTDGDWKGQEKVEARRAWAYGKRRDFLAHLLALYGESVDTVPLERPGDLSRSVRETRHLNAQAALWAALPELSSARFRGADLTRCRDLSPFQKRCEILFGFTLNRSGSLTLPLTRDGLTCVTDRRFLSMDLGVHAMGGDSAGTGGERLLPIPESHGTIRLTCSHISELKSLIFPLGRGVVFDSLLRKGTRIQAYRLAVNPACEEVRLLFNFNGTRLLLTTADSRKHAVRLAHLLRHYLIYLNMACEGLHLMEEILLRLPGEKTRNPDGDTSQIQTLHIICPNWTDRFADPEFRRLFIAVAASHLPAHLMARFHFFSFDEMNIFEKKWHGWRRARQGGNKADGHKLGQALLRMVGGESL